MEYTKNSRTFIEAVMDTPLNALCLKSTDKQLFGLLVSPSFRARPKSEHELQAKLLEADALGQPFKVRGHGWEGEKQFV